MCTSGLRFLSSHSFFSQGEQTQFFKTILFFCCCVEKEEKKKEMTSLLTRTDACLFLCRSRIGEMSSEHCAGLLFLEIYST